MNKIVFVVTALALCISGCKNAINMNSDVFKALARATSVGQNVLPMQAGNCGPDGYVNEPCVSVTICKAGTSSCQTIPNVLVDTGSFGLRLFPSVITVNLDAENDPSGNPIGQCAMFGTANDWGSVKYADIVLGGEKASKVAIQAIDKNFGTVPKNCTNPLPDPQTAGFNGILGVGNLIEDCGEGCADAANNGVYYSCKGTTCSGVTVALRDQVANPVAFLPFDNNGVVLSFPSVPTGGSISVKGSLILGIGTQANNTPSAGVKVFQLDSFANFSTQLKGKTLDGSFIDSGSNGLFFPNLSAPDNLTECSSSGTAPGFYCPASTTSFSGIQTGSDGATTATVDFQIANAERDVASNSNVFVDLGGTATSSFDWGIPFFFGRTIYIGIEGRAASIGTGPYFAY